MQIVTPSKIAFSSWTSLISFLFCLQSVWVVSFLATVLLDVDLGLAVAVIYSIITVVARSQRLVVCKLLLALITCFTKNSNKMLSHPG